MKKIFTAILAAGALMCATQPAQSAIDAASFILRGKSPEVKLNGSLSKAVRSFDLSKPLANCVFSSHSTGITLENFPVGLNEQATLDLRVAPSCVDANTVIMVGSKQIPVPYVLTYMGTIQGQPGSEVIFSYANGEIQGWVRHANGRTFAIAPYPGSTHDIQAHTLFQTDVVDEILQKPKAVCATDEDKTAPGFKTPSQFESELRAMGKSLAKHGDRVLDNRMLELQVIVETTTSYYTGVASRNTTRATGHIIGLFNAVNILYRRELNVNVIIPFIQIWTDSEPDPYKNDGTDTPALLNEVGTRWSRITNRQRDVVHVLDGVGNSSNPNGTIVLGIANGIGAVCNGSLSNAYSVSGIQRYNAMPTTNYVNDVVTISHEIGHNMGAYHTHNCKEWNPALDSCLTNNTAFSTSAAYSTETCNSGNPIPIPGSIMSYCDLTNSTRTVQFTFLPRVYTFLRSTLEGKSCVAEVTQPQIRMIGPVGNRKYNGGSTLPIEWTSARVQTVKIELSTDAGTSWSEITSGLPAQSGNTINGQGIYSWIVPRINTTQGRIRVVDMSNAAVNDTSWANFTIESIVSSLAMSTNLDGKSYGQKESINLQWTRQNVTAVNLQFSKDNGANWETITPNVSGTTSSFSMPDIIAEKCWVRIVSTQDAGLIAQTGPFSIGVEKVTLIKPTGGETICAGKDYVITWSYSNIGASKLSLQYSVNNGSSWSNITNATGIDPWTGVFRWTVPAAAVSPSTLIRVVYRTDTTIQNVSAPVNVSSEANCVTTGINENMSVLSPVLTVSPNPAQDILQLSFTLPAPASGNSLGTTELFITDMKGTVVMNILKTNSMQPGEYRIPVQIPNLPSGAYFVHIRTGDYRNSISVNVQR